ncbi:MAG: hypothetical protein V9F01_11435 [Chitinophagaceae bacterium]
MDSLSWLDNRSQNNLYLRQSSLLTNHSISLNGGNEFHAYYGSLAYTNDRSVNKTNLNRYQMNMKQDFSFSKAVKFDLTTNVSYEQSQDFILTDLPVNANLPYVMYADENGRHLSMAYLLRHDPFRSNSEALSGISLDYIPLDEPGRTKNNNTTFATRINAGLTIKLLKGLTAPEMTTFSGPFTAAMDTASATVASSAATAATSPCTDTIAPPVGSDCMRPARIAIKRAPSSSVSTPATTAAANSPTL